MPYLRHNERVEVDVEIADWEQECCGTRISLNQVVTWDVFLRPDSLPGENAWGSGLTDLIESHHEMYTGGGQVTGRVARIRAVWTNQAIPAPTADVADIEQIWGAGELADGVDYGREDSPNMFVVTLAVADTVKLPSSPAEQKTDVTGP